MALNRYRYPVIVASPEWAQLNRTELPSNDALNPDGAAGSSEVA